MRYAALILILLAGCGGPEESSTPQLSEQEKACRDKVLDLKIQHSEKSMAEYSGALEDGSISAYLATDQLREAQLDQQICELESQCYNGLTEEQRLLAVWGCTKDRVKERADGFQ